MFCEICSRASYIVCSLNTHRVHNHIIRKASAISSFQTLLASLTSPPRTPSGTLAGAGLVRSTSHVLLPEAFCRCLGFFVFCLGGCF